MLSNARLWVAIKAQVNEMYVIHEAAAGLAACSIKDYSLSGCTAAGLTSPLQCPDSQSDNPIKL